MGYRVVSRWSPVSGESLSRDDQRLDNSPDIPTVLDGRSVPTTDQYSTREVGMMIVTDREYYSEEEKQEIVTSLLGYQWERFITLTTSRDYELPDLVGYVRDFLRRVDGTVESRTDYFLVISGTETDPFSRRESARPFNTRLHIHGVLGGVGDVSNERIEKCWRSVETKFSPLPDITFSLGNTLGFSQVTHYDRRPEGLYYLLNQTKRGYVFTNTGVTV
jgi:hypothetical protein